MFGEVERGRKSPCVIWTYTVRPTGPREASDQGHRAHAGFTTKQRVLYFMRGCLCYGWCDLVFGGAEGRGRGEAGASRAEGPADPGCQFSSIRCRSSSVQSRWKTNLSPACAAAACLLWPSSSSSLSLSGPMLARPGASVGEKAEHGSAREGGWMPPPLHTGLPWLPICNNNKDGLVMSP